MITVSDAYKELVKSNIRPRVEPHIKVSGKDQDGNNISFVWSGKDIQSMKYTKEVDPLGRTLPFIELTWEEIYIGKFNQNAFPIKYEKASKYMQVQLTFVQDLEFYPIWKTLYNIPAKWKDLYNNSITWKDLFKSRQAEEIEYPKLFLVAEPKIQGNKIVWTARDLLSFLEMKHIRAGGENGVEYDFINPMRYFLLNERANFIKSPAIIEAIQQTDDNLVSFQNNNSNLKLKNKIIFNDTTKNILKNYAQTANAYLDIDGDGLKIQSSLIPVYSYMFEPKYKFTLNDMFNYPEVALYSRVSSYSFNSHFAEKDESKKYIKEPTEIFEQFGQTFYKTSYDEYGDVPSARVNTISYCIDEKPNSVEIIPIYWKEEQYSMTFGVEGEVFEENNPLNIHNERSEQAQLRAMLVRKYFSQSSAITFSGLSNLGIDTGDLVEVETALYDNSEQQITKKAIVVETEIEYNGALKQKFIVHEVNSYDN